MKKVSELKQGDAIRVGKSDYPQLAELLDKEGYIWSHGVPMKEFIPWRDKIDLYEYNGDILLTFNGSKFVRFNTHMTNPDGGNRWENASDFLRPEPRFKVGDLVCHVNNSNISGRVTGLVHNGERWVYTVFPYSGVFKEEKISFASPDEVTKTGSEQQFEIGKEYEFSDDEKDWFKGEFIAKYKNAFVAEVHETVDSYLYIRPIQPRKITRWINICPDGRVLRKSYETEQEARDKACQGGMHDCKQVRLSGIL